MCLLLCLASVSTAQPKPPPAKAEVKTAKTAKAAEKTKKIKKATAQQTQQAQVHHQVQVQAVAAARVQVIQQDVEGLKYQMALRHISVYEKAAKKYKWRLGRHPKLMRHLTHWRQWVYLRCTVDAYKFQRKSLPARVYLKVKGKTPKSPDYWYKIADQAAKKAVRKKPSQRPRH